MALHTLQHIGGDKAYMHEIYTGNQVGFDDDVNYDGSFVIPADFKLAWLSRLLVGGTGFATVRGGDRHVAARLDVTRSALVVAAHKLSKEFHWKTFAGGVVETAPFAVLWEFLWPVPVPVHPGDLCSFFLPPMDTNGTPTVDAIIPAIEFKIIDY